VTKFLHIASFLSCGIAVVCHSRPVHAGAIAGGFNNTIVLQPDGNVVAYGVDLQGDCTVPAGLTGVVSVAASNLNCLALKSDGTVVAWGSDGYNNLVSPPSGLQNVVAISAGFFYDLALEQDGTVVQWSKRSVAPLPTGLTNVSSIIAGPYNAFALKSDRTLVPWGYSQFGQSAIPANFNNVIDVALDQYNVVALQTNGTLTLWGYNPSNHYNVPTGLNDVAAVAAGDYHLVALKNDGTVAAWGDGGAAQVPVGLSGVVAISAGGTQSLALKNDGTVVAWGSTAAPQTSTIFAGTDAIWNDSRGGNFLWRNSWQFQVPSTAVSNAVFMANGTYKINFTAYEQAKSISVSNGNVAFHLNGNAYNSVGAVNVASGLTVDEGQLLAPEVNVVAGGHLSGNGFVLSRVNVNAGGTLHAGDPLGSMVVSSLGLKPGSHFAEQMDGSTVGSFNQAVVGSVDIDESNLDLLLGFKPTVGSSYTILENIGSSPVVGTFANLPQEGVAQAQYLGQTYAFQINYQGGDGNDIVLTNVAVPEPASGCVVLGCGIITCFIRRRKSCARC